MKYTIGAFFFLFIFVGIATTAFAQGVPVASGGDANGSGGKVSYTVGEVVYTTIQSGNGVLIEGIQQAYTPAELPITLLTFTATVTDKAQVQLYWVTVSEKNNQYFEVERSANGLSFNEVVMVKSKGNSANAQDYTALDANPSTGISYYRLKQTDIDGKITYSKSVSVNIQPSSDELKAYPNPTTSVLNLQIGDATNRSLTYALYTIEGKLISQKLINSNSTTISTAELASGTYLLQVKDKGVLIKSFKIIKK